MCVGGAWGGGGGHTPRNAPREIFKQGEEKKPDGTVSSLPYSPLPLPPQRRGEDEERERVVG